jgi:Transposase IS66 family.
MDGEPRVTQQIELIEVPLIREEHRSYPVWCPTCGKIHYMPFPPEVYKEGLFKERITALVAYMKNVCHASFSTIRKYIRDVLGEKVSRGYLRKVIQKVSQSLEAPYNELLDRLPLETIVNVDETGHKENGGKFWTWVFKADLYVLFKIDKSRGSKVLIDVLGKEFDGVLGCDYFSAYRKYMKDFNVSIQFCIAHLIRDIRFLITLKDPETKAYGQKLLDEVKNMFKVIHDRENMTPETFTTALEDAKEKITTAALNDVPSTLDKNGKEEKREAQNMANRFRRHGKEYFQFITTPGMDPTNNVAEQAIRFVGDRSSCNPGHTKRKRKAEQRAFMDRCSHMRSSGSICFQLHTGISQSIFSESTRTITTPRFILTILHLFRVYPLRFSLPDRSPLVIQGYRPVSPVTMDKMSSGPERLQTSNVNPDQLEGDAPLNP